MEYYNGELKIYLIMALAQILANADDFVQLFRNIGNDMSNTPL